MTKFKFGDKVWHDEFGLCVVIGTHMYCGKSAYTIAHGNGDVKSCYMEEHLTKVSDWIPCSERMPELHVKVFVIDKFERISTDYLLFIYDDGIAEWAGYENYTHWMYVPEMPEAKE